MMTINEIKQEVEKVEGWFDFRQIDIVYPYIQALPKGSLLVELGTYRGRSTKFFRLSNPEIEIITIDANYKWWTGVAEPKVILPEVLELGNIEYIVDFTSNVAKTFNREIDFLFIDTDHSFEGVLRDLNEWAHFVKKGGYILFHDYDEPHIGVMRAVATWLEEHKEFEEIKVGHLLGLIKHLPYEN